MGKHFGEYFGNINKIFKVHTLFANKFTSQDLSYTSLSSNVTNGRYVASLVSISFKSSLPSHNVGIFRSFQLFLLQISMWWIMLKDLFPFTPVNRTPCNRPFYFGHLWSGKIFIIFWWLFCIDFSSLLSGSPIRWMLVILNCSSISYLAW